MEILADHTIILNRRGHLPEEDDVSFVVKISAHLKAAVTLFFKQERIEVLINDYPSSNEATEYFINNSSHTVEETPASIMQEISIIHSILSDSTIRVLSIIKYYLPYIDLSEQLFAIKSRRWRLPGFDWKSLPSSLSIVFDARTVPRFDPQTCNLIQESINEGIFPLLECVICIGQKMNLCPITSGLMQQ